MQPPRGLPRGGLSQALEAAAELAPKGGDEAAAAAASMLLLVLAGNIVVVAAAGDLRVPDQLRARLGS